MGEAHVVAFEGVHSDPPMTMPQGHEQELISGGGELAVSSVIEVVMSEGHSMVDGTPLPPMTSPQGKGENRS